MVLTAGGMGSAGTATASATRDGLEVSVVSLWKLSQRYLLATVKTGAAGTVYAQVKNH